MRERERKYTAGTERFTREELAGPESPPALCAVCGNPQDEHGGPLYAHRYVAPQPAPAESPWTVADEALQPEPPASQRPQVETAHLGLCPCGHPEDYHRPGPGARVCAFGWPVAANRCNCLGWRTTSEPDVESAARRLLDALDAYAQRGGFAAGTSGLDVQRASAIARAALAKRSEPVQDFRISPDPREDEF